MNNNGELIGEGLEVEALRETLKLNRKESSGESKEGERVKPSPGTRTAEYGMAHERASSGQ